MKTLLSLSFAALLCMPAVAGVEGCQRLADGQASERPQVSGVIRTWGHGSRDKDILGRLLNDWQQGFSRLQPGIDFQTDLRGDATAIGGLYTGAADLALMERPPLAIELDGYLSICGHPPSEVAIATGSLDVVDHAFAPAVLVHRDNPIAQLTLTQLDAIFGADRRRGGAAIRTWGDLGLGGDWARRPVHIYTYSIDQEVSQFFERTVMAGSQKWASPLIEFSGPEAGQRIADALAKDRYGIALSALQYRNRQLKPLALGTQAGGPFFEPTRETVMRRQYPLTRTVSIYFDRIPGRPMDAKLKAYLTYLLSQEGQEAIAQDGRYMPLPPDMVRRQLEKLQ